jgi:hypothetical protein
MNKLIFFFHESENIRKISTVNTYNLQIAQSIVSVYLIGGLGEWMKCSNLIKPYVG